LGKLIVKEYKEGKLRGGFLMGHEESVASWQTFESLINYS